MIDPLHKALNHYEKLRQEEENVRRDPDPNDSSNYVSMLSYKDSRPMSQSKEGVTPQEASRRLSKGLRKLFRAKSENEVEWKLLRVLEHNAYAASLVKTPRDPISACVWFDWLNPIPLLQDYEARWYCL